MDRPIVVNSLLCFIHNYRESVLPHELSALVNNYFPKSVISVAHATLVELLPPHLAANPPSDILFLFDRICKSEQSPVFAAADLTILPLRLITNEDDSKNELLREIRQLKRFIQDALNGRLEEPTPNSNRSVDFLPFRKLRQLHNWFVWLYTRLLLIYLKCMLSFFM